MIAATDNITICNAVVNKAVALDFYYRCFVQNVYWFGRTAVAVDQGLSEANSTTIRIPLTATFGKTYVGPLEFDVAYEKDKFFTLRPGDIIVKGMANEASLTKESLKEKYDYVITITSVTDNRIGSPNMHHWLVLGS